MYINNIESILKANMPLKLKLSEGSVVSGKIISLQSNEGIIKLYDGTIIPAIFISENIMDKEKYVRFKVEGFEDDKILLKALTLDENEIREDSLEGILKNLNVPIEKGRDIVMSLIKFNLPANDENILSIYKNISFLNTLKDMSDKDILAFLEKYTGKEFTKESSEFLAAKDLIAKLSSIDIDFLTFLTENEIPKDVSSIIKTQNIVKDGFFINGILNELNSILAQDENSKNNTETLRQVLDILKNNPEKLPLIIKHLQQDASKTTDMSFTNILKNLPDNEILNFLQKYIGKDVTYESRDFLVFKDLITQLSSIDIDFLTFLTENEIPKDVSSMIKTQNIVKDGFFINKILNELNSVLTQDENGKNNTETLRQVLDILKNNPEKLPLIVKQLQQDVSKTTDVSFTNILKDMPDNEILNFLQKYIGKDVTYESRDFLVFKDLITQLSKLNNNLSTNVMQNDEALVFVNHKFIDDNTILDKILKAIKLVVDLKDESKEIYTIKQALNILKISPEKLQLTNQQFLKEVLYNSDILKNIYNNYNIYAFNALQNGSLYKNNIIIKHKYKNSKQIDVNDVKVFITIETPNLGIIENYLYKKNKDIMITIKVEDKFVALFKNNILLLKNRLKIKGFNPLNISVEKLKSKNDMVGLSSFFNEYMLKELDVMV